MKWSCQRKWNTHLIRTLDPTTIYKKKQCPGDTIYKKYRGQRNILKNTVEMQSAKSRLGNYMTNDLVTPRAERDRELVGGRLQRFKEISKRLIDQLQCVHLI